MKEQIIWMIGTNPLNFNLPAEIKNIGSIEELPEKDVFAIVLSKNPNHQPHELILQLREKAEYRFTPIFLDGQFESREELTDKNDLFDGSADENMLLSAEEIHQRLSMIPETNLTSENDALILLSYLFSRPKFKLKGHVNFKETQLFEYPLLSVLFPAKQHYDKWRYLQDLVSSDWLTTGALLSEIQTCALCSSGLLNIKNTCPSCQSINIRSQRFAHCYTCGKIGPVPEFLRQDRLVCSRCNTKLRTIGIDYDKPQEDKLCNDCGHYFIESDVRFICLVCNHTSSANELTSRSLHEYLLTRRGEYLVRGVEKGIYRNFKYFFKVIDYDSFMSIVSWQSKLAERYPSHYFSILTMQIINAQQALEENGVATIEKMLSELFRHLKGLFREGDLSARMDGTMLFFLPMADEKGCSALVERIKLFLCQHNKTNENKGLEIGMSYITSAEIMQSRLEGELVITELYTRIIENNIYLFTNSNFEEQNTTMFH